jgi:hypothetical protein
LWPVAVSGDQHEQIQASERSGGVSTAEAACETPPTANAVPVPAPSAVVGSAERPAQLDARRDSAESAHPSCRAFLHETKRPREELDAFAAREGECVRPVRVLRPSPLSGGGLAPGGQHTAAVTEHRASPSPSPAAKPPPLVPCRLERLLAGDDPTGAGAPAEPVRIDGMTSFVVGRAETADLIVDSRKHPRMVSRHHARLTCTEGGTAWSIEDLGASNGTAVNSVPLGAGGTQTLVHGDLLRFGRQQSDVLFRFWVAEDQQDEASFYM